MMVVILAAPLLVRAVKSWGSTQRSSNWMALHRQTEKETFLLLKTANLISRYSTFSQKI